MRDESSGKGHKVDSNSMSMSAGEMSQQRWGHTREERKHTR